MKPMKFAATWSAEDVSTLVTLLGERKSFRAIGAALGKTREAVAGKVGRLRDAKLIPPAAPRRVAATRPRNILTIPKAGTRATSDRDRCTFLEGAAERGNTHRLKRCPYVCTVSQTGRRVSWCSAHAGLVFANWGEW